MKASYHKMMKTVVAEVDILASLSKRDKLDLMSDLLLETGMWDALAAACGSEKIGEIWTKRANAYDARTK